MAVGGVDAGDCTAAPCATLTYAIGQAVNGDVIDVGPGTFNNGGAAVNVNKSVVIAGEQAGVDARTRAAATESILTIPLSLSADNVVLDGFTITCGTCVPFGSGVATSSANSGHRVVNNIITGNIIGIFFGSSGATQSVVQFNHIFDNNVPGAASGTGIYSDSGLLNGVIDQNRLTGHTTAQINIIGAATPASVMITNNQFPLDTIDDANAVVLFNNNGTLIERNVVTGGVASTFFLGGNDANITIRQNTVSGGTSNAVSISDVGFGPNGAATIVGNSFTGMLRGISVGAGNNGPIEVHLNRLENNGTDIRTTAVATVNAENNWFGCNAGPAACGAVTVFAGSTIDVDPWLVMNIADSPDPITILQTSTVTTDFTRNNLGAVVTGAEHFPNGVSITFGATGGSVSPNPVPTLNSTAATTFTPSAVGTATVTSTLDAQTVNTTITVTQATPTVTVSSSLNPSTYGQAVTFTATVTAGATGTIQFQANGVNLGGPVAIVGNTAQITTSALPAGTHAITAIYSGDATYAGATSAPLSQTVNQAVPAVGLTSVPNPSSTGQAVTFTATVPADATGTVEFRDGGVAMGAPVAIVGGTAQFTTSALSAGTHVITAFYSGDTNYTSATSAPLNQVVNAAGDADLGVTGSSSAAPPITPGTTTTITFSIVNGGPGAAFNTALTSTIAPGATVTAATPTQGTCTIGATVDCAIGTLAAGGTATVTLQVTLPATPGAATFTGTVTSTSPDPVLTNNTATVTIGVIAVTAIPTFDPRVLMLLAAALAFAAARVIR
ncbi:MAG TPA: Ig-like domain repeat protein [Thermoanaerobaculia bacterium]|nr:Ig-like domain repeat protein [Thermoanaerobaculia bacterium]